jgi:predicted Zn-ribbon and HTH transcriptional regulator
MYWSNQEVDTRIYPSHCPSCSKSKWLDFDWETGLGYCQLCGWDPDNEDVMHPSVGEG